MRATNVVVACILLVLMCLFGCGKKSGLEGKVVDGKGKPMAGVKVVAKQVQPIKGYEQFETTTGSDGAFKFSKLFPTSAYELITYPDGTTKNLTIKTESAPEGQTRVLPEPITIRFQFSKDGATALDTNTGLMWAKNANIAGRGMPWGEAMGWVSSLDIGGHKDWRLPNKVELEQFAKSGGSGKPVDQLASIGFTNIQAGCYWSGTEDGNYVAWYVDVKDGVVDSYAKRNDYYVWPVRSGQ